MADQGLLAPRNAATFPEFVHPNELANGYANIAAQIQDAMGLPSRYPQSPFWGMGAGRYAYGSGAPYGNPAGRNAPWWVTGANGQAGQYPNPGTILGQGQSQIPAGQPGAYTGGQSGGGLLGQPKVAVDQSFGQQGLLGSGLNPQQPNVQSGQGPQPSYAPGYGNTPNFQQQFQAAPDNQSLQALYRSNPQGFAQLVMQGKISNDQLSQITGGLGDPNSYARVR